MYSAPISFISITILIFILIRLLSNTVCGVPLAPAMSLNSIPLNDNTRARMNLWNYNRMFHVLKPSTNTRNHWIKLGLFRKSQEALIHFQRSVCSSFLKQFQQCSANLKLHIAITISSAFGIYQTFFLRLPPGLDVLIFLPKCKFWSV